MDKKVLKKEEPVSKLNLQTLTGSFLNPETAVREWDIREGDAVADFGCGNGFFAIPLARNVGEKGKVYAVDVLAVPLEAVTSKAYLEKLDNIVTIRADLEKKNALVGKVGNGDCQHVFIANALCTAKKKKLVLAEAKRILAPKGQLIVVEWKKNVSNAFRSFGPPVESRFAEDELRDLVTEAGLKLVDRFAAGEFHFGMRFRKK